MKNTPYISPREMHLARIFASHADVCRAIHQAIHQPAGQRDIFGGRCVATKAAAGDTTLATVKMAVYEAHAITRLALPPSARTIPTRREHALLLIAIAQLLDELAAIQSAKIPYEAIAAAQHVAVQVRDWLVLNNQVVLQKGDSASASMVGRHRTPDALNRESRAKLAHNEWSSWHKSGSDASAQPGPGMFTQPREQAAGD